MEAKDAISCLPVEILGRILSNLPTKQAASTSVLSKRWRNVFVLVSSIDLDSLCKASRYQPDSSRNFVTFVERLLYLQGNSPVKNLTLKTRVVVNGDVHPIRVQRWICNALERGVVDLDLIIHLTGQTQPVPSLIFKSKTLVKLRLGRGYTIKLSQDVSLPMLRTLYLDSVDFDGDHHVFETLISRCPVLEELVIDERQWVDWTCSVSSPSLKRLRIQFDCSPSISFDVPNLVYFESSCAFRSKCPNLKFLVEARLNLQVEETQIRNGYTSSGDMINLINAIRNVRVLHLSSDVLELIYFYCQDLPVFNSLVRLSIESDEKRGWQILPLLIKNSPNLITLIFKGLEHKITKNCGDACVCSDSEENISSYLSSSGVKVLEILSYQGTTRELNQMKQFLEKLSCLELVKICVANKLQVPIDTQQLLTIPRASSNCKIQIIF